MTPLSTELWLVVSGIALAAALAFLHTLATIVRNQTYLHDHRGRVESIKSEMLAVAAEAEEMRSAAGNTGPIDAVEIGTDRPEDRLANRAA